MHANVTASAGATREGQHESLVVDPLRLHHYHLPRKALDRHDQAAPLPLAGAHVSPQEKRLLLLGLDSAGKTSLLVSMASR